MRTIQNYSGSDSSSDTSGQDGVINDLTEWQTDVFEDFRQNIICIKGDWSNLENNQIIRLANEKVSLKSLLDNYKIDFMEVYSPSGWTHRCSCPFPNHNDSSPSFSYNSLDDRFNCFGCSRGGRAVQFKAFIENKKQVIAAIELLETFTNADNAYAEVQDSPNDKIDSLLKENSDIIRNFLQNNKSKRAFDFAMGLTQYVDRYLLKYSVCIDCDHLNGAIQIVKRKLNNYHE